jgi:hypothetical protein
MWGVPPNIKGFEHVGVSRDLHIAGTKSRLAGPNTKSFRAKLLLNRKIDVKPSNPRIQNKAVGLVETR